MNVPPQPPLGEEPEKQPAPQPAEETQVQPAPTAETVSEETEQPLTHAATEDDIPTQPVSFSESQATETTLADEHGASTLPDDELDAEDLDEDKLASASAFTGVFIKKSVLIGAACAVVLVALLAALLVFVNRPKDPPSDWILSYTPPAGTSTASKVLYYLHWTNQNGELKGQLQLSALANGAPQSLTAPASGLYNRDNHIIYVVITINGQAGTLMGKINDNNDTLTLNQVGATSQSSQLVFHVGSADDYKQAAKKLTSTKK